MNRREFISRAALCVAAGLWIGASFAGSDKPGDFDGEVWRDFNGQSVK